MNHMNNNLTILTAVTLPDVGHELDLGPHWEVTHI